MNENQSQGPTPARRHLDQVETADNIDLDFNHLTSRSLSCASLPETQTSMLALLVSINNTSIDRDVGKCQTCTLHACPYGNIHMRALLVCTRTHTNTHEHMSLNIWQPTHACTAGTCLNTDRHTHNYIHTHGASFKPHFGRVLSTFTYKCACIFHQTLLCPPPYVSIHHLCVLSTPGASENAPPCWEGATGADSGSHSTIRTRCGWVIYILRGGLRSSVPVGGLQWGWGLYFVCLFGCVFVCLFVCLFGPACVRPRGSLCVGGGKNDC